MMGTDKDMKVVFDLLVQSDEDRYLAWFLVALTPWSTLPLYSEDKPRGTKGAVPCGTLAAREGVRATTRICGIVTGAFEHFESISALKKAVLEDEAWTYERDTVGMKIRCWNAKGGHWRLQMMFALLVESMHTDGGGERSIFLSFNASTDRLLFRLFSSSWRLAEMP